MPHNIYGDPFARNLYEPLKPVAEPPGYLVGSEAPLQLARQRQEVFWVFDGDVRNAPRWVDRSWASCVDGPTLSVPVDFSEKAVPVFLTVRKGDTLIYVPPEDIRDLFGRFHVIPGEPPPLPVEQEPQGSGASMEDVLLNGAMHVADLSADARAQLEGRLVARMGEVEAKRFLVYLAQRPAKP